MQSNTSWLLPGTPCWYDLQESDLTKPAFLFSSIKSFSEPSNKAILNHQDLEVPISLLYETNPDLPATGIEDMVELSCLNEAELLSNLSKRYKQDLIFTYIGPTLLVLNPYKALPHEFTEEKRLIYEKQVRSQDPFNQKASAPHVFATSALAYRQLFDHDKNQAIVISGESGAGKTENAKYAMKFLTSMSNSTISQAKIDETPIEDKILSCNPVLEAFGNAKTVRNDNSSRFGKYVRILVEKDSRRIQGAAITNYLLEKSRIITQAPGERNYHIFYQLLKGGVHNELCKGNGIDQLISKGGDLLNQLGLPKDPKYYNYLKKSECFDVENIDDIGLFKEVVDSFITMKFSGDEINAIWLLLASVLLIGNLEIDDKTYTDTNPCIVGPEPLFLQICNLLQTEKKALEKALILKTRQIGKQTIESPLTKAECEAARDSLSRNLYDKLFNWLVKRLNFTILPAQDINPGIQIRKSVKNVRKSLLVPESHRLSIGLLDIFGFENFKVNSFEQLCINFTNEKLQQLYIQYIFKSEEKEFIEEGLSQYLNQLSYQDNQSVIDLIDKYPMGIFDLLDEATSLGSSDDKKLLEKICKTHKDSPAMKIPKSVIENFTVIHTAKTVEYNIMGFRNKNKDEVSKETTDAIFASNNIRIVHIFKGLCGHEAENDNHSLLKPGANLFVQQPAAQKGKNEKFLGAKFRFQMKELMDELSSCDVNFIRCVKTNEIKKKDYFLDNYVLLQIRYLGVLESIKVRKSGYPVRKEYKGFYQQYQEINKARFSLSFIKHIQNKADFKAFSNEIINIAVKNPGPEFVLFGKTKIYLRTKTGNELDAALMVIFKRKKEKASKILKQMRVYMIKKTIKSNLKKIHKLIKRFCRIQAFWKRRVARRKFLNKKKCIKIIGKNINHRRMKVCLEKIRIKIKKIKICETKIKALKQMEIFRKKFFDTKKKNILIKYSKIAKAITIALEKKRQEEELLQKILLAEKESKNKAEKEAKIAELKKQAEIEAKLAAEAKLLESEKQEKLKQEREKAKAEQEKTQIVLNQEVLNNKKIENDSKPQIKVTSPKSFKPEEPPKINEPIENKTKEESKKPDPIKEESKENQTNLLKRFSEYVPHISSKSNSILFNYVQFGKSKEQARIQKSQTLSMTPLVNINSLDSELIKNVRRTNFMEFCEKQLPKRTSWGKQIPLSKLMSYSTSSLSDPLTSLGKEDDKLSKKVYKLILEYLNAKNDEKELEVVNKIIDLTFWGSWELKDEIFLQLCKQLTNNGDDILVMKLYVLLSMLSSTYQVSLRLYFPLLNFLLNQIEHPDSRLEDPDTMKSFAKFSFLRIIRHFEGQPRKYPPMNNELESIQSMQQIQISVSLPNNWSKTIPVMIESYTTVHEVLEFLLKKLDIFVRKPYYGLFLVKNRNGEIAENLLQVEESILDVISVVETEKTDFETRLTGKKQGFSNLWFYDYRIVLKIKAFFKLFNDDIDTLCMYYSQHQSEIISGNMNVTESEALELGGLALIVNLGEYIEENNVDFKINAEDYLPRTFCKPGILEKLVLEYIKAGKMEKIDAMRNYVRKIEDHDLFMAHSITISYVKIEANGTENPRINAIFCVKPEKILILEEKTRKKVADYEIRQISKWGVNKNNVFLAITEDGITHFCEGKKCTEINYMINGYVNLSLGRGIDYLE